MNKPEVGQIIYSLNVGNAARDREQKLTNMVVSKVGRKYFSCHLEGFTRETQFHLDSWREKSEYSACYKLYSNPEEWEAEKERGNFIKLIKGCFSQYGNTTDLSSDKLKRIVNIINE